MKLNPLEWPATQQVVAASGAVAAIAGLIVSWQTIADAQPIATKSYVQTYIGQSVSAAVAPLTEQQNFFALQLGAAANGISSLTLAAANANLLMLAPSITRLDRLVDMGTASDSDVLLDLQYHQQYDLAISQRNRAQCELNNAMRAVPLVCQ